MDSLRLAVAQPRSIVGDLVNNVAEHAALLSSVEARVVVFPELSLTGYDMIVAPVAEDDPVLVPLVDACRRCTAKCTSGATNLSTTSLERLRRSSRSMVGGSGLRSARTLGNPGMWAEPPRWVSKPTSLASGRPKKIELCSQHELHA